MKRLLSVLVLGCLLIGLVACDDEVELPIASITKTTTTTTRATTTTSGVADPTDPSETDPTDGTTDTTPSETDPTTTVTGNATTAGTTKTTAKTTTKTTTKATTTTTKTTTQKASTGKLTPISYSSGYYRSLLAKDNANFVKAYDLIYNAVDKVEASVDIWDLNLNKSDYLTVMEYYSNDHPEHFWFLGETEFSMAASIVVEIRFCYVKNLSTKSQVAAAKKEFNTATNKLLNGLDDSMSDFEREKEIYLRLIKLCSYKNQGDVSGTAYGALVKKYAVCDGYSRAFQYLCHLAGLPCLRVFGVGHEDHSWNMVKIDGAWYHTDVTWDDPLMSDPKGFVGLSYLNCTEKAIRLRRAIYTYETFNEVIIPFNLPSATKTTANYFVKSGLSVSSYNHNTVLKACKQAAAEGRNWMALKVTGSDSAFNKAFRNDYSNLKKDMEKAGYTGYFKAGISGLLSTDKDDQEVVYYYIK